MESILMVLVLAVVSQTQTAQSIHQSKLVTSGKCPDVTLAMCEEWAARDGKPLYVHGRIVESLAVGGCYKQSLFVDGYFFSPYIESGRDCSTFFPCLCLDDVIFEEVVGTDDNTEEPVTDDDPPPTSDDLPPTESPGPIKEKRSLGCWSRKHPGCIAVSNIIRYRGATLSQCKHLCNENLDCVAIEFYNKYGGNYTVYREGDCQLNNDINKDKVGRCDGVHNNLDCYYKKTCSEGKTQEEVEDDLYTTSARGRMSGSSVSEEGKGVNEEAAPVAPLPKIDVIFEEVAGTDDNTEEPVTDDDLPPTTDDPPPNTDDGIILH